ncbi:hypothetical protein ESB00_11075 [Oleiharenicola lentus]|jgi:biopolymer transport protein ExbB|uniref:MotA/TolQ/ExbB proton channel domain-containing protein n=1 Tax=Oleiharenicola lentus TaxID=2508720 RepID=A0A4Q1CBS6_9BACT|nr:MotA/TolQ/ExbB proton channel family protein [Oleiharenicola lentus]RXK56381.1 hypothetical protein ESB00_11075 [Oleiharenicola lentus]
MSASVIQFVRQGGVVAVALLLLAAWLYAQGLLTLFWVRGLRLRLNAVVPQAGLAGALRQWRAEAAAAFSRRQELTRLGIAVAPLLGLFGTVLGMTELFSVIAAEGGRRTVADMADGLALALYTTELGLGVAITGLILLQGAERQMRRRMREAVEIEERSLRAV